MSDPRELQARFAELYPQAARLGIAVDDEGLVLPFAEHNVGDINGGRLHAGVIAQLAETCARVELQRTAMLSEAPRVLRVSVQAFDAIGPIDLQARCHLADHGRGAVTATVDICARKDERLMAQATILLSSPEHGTVALLEPAGLAHE